VLGTSKASSIKGIHTYINAFVALFCVLRACERLEAMRGDNEASESMIGDANAANTPTQRVAEVLDLTHEDANAPRSPDVTVLSTHRPHQAFGLKDDSI
jgi:hypothetical protein